jgi:steroid delta-isomerase-like uncharacterized protein
MSVDQEANRAVARRLAEEVFGQGDMTTYDDIFAAAYVQHNMPVPDLPGTKAGYKQLVAATRKAFPDVQVRILNLVSEGDFVVFNDHVTATSTGDFLGIPASGRSLTWTEIHFLRIVDGKILEHWFNFDQLGIMRSLGTVPA